MLVLRAASVRGGKKGGRLADPQAGAIRIAPSCGSASVKGCKAAVALLPVDNALRAIALGKAGEGIALTLTSARIASKARHACVGSQNARTGVRAANFAAGGCALWGALARERDRKADVHWCDPRRRRGENLIGSS